MHLPTFVYLYQSPIHPVDFLSRKEPISAKHPIRNNIIPKSTNIFMMIDPMVFGSILSPIIDADFDFELKCHSFFLDSKNVRDEIQLHRFGFFENQPATELTDTFLSHDVYQFRMREG
jgi:hypothetical protein